VLDSRTRTVIWLRTSAEVGYVASVAILAVVATWNPNRKAYPAFDVTLALCMPALVALYPLVLVVVGNAWHFTGADHGGVTWPVTAAYVAVFTVAALINVGLVTLLLDLRPRRRAASHR
jgi:hypothetical protein